jgi:ABC-type Fe3+ transport system substrate-binding protein
MNVDEREINMVAFAPCPLELPLLGKLDKLLEEYGKRTGERLTFVIPSFSEERDKYDNFSDITGLEMLPDVLVSMGFGDFMKCEFVQDFLTPENFAVCGLPAMNENFSGSSYTDKEGCYSLISSFPTVFLVDMNELGDLPVPVRWSDLLENTYRNKFVISGKNDVVNDAVLLTIFDRFGEEGVKKLAGNIMAVGGYSKIVAEMAGQENKPALYAIPYYFALRELGKPEMRLVWPEDGAILDPVYMIVKRNSLEKAKVIIDYLTGKDFGELSSGMGFPVPHAGVDNKLPEDAGFSWVGWDFIRNRNIHALKESLADIFRSSKSAEIV